MSATGAIPVELGDAPDPEVPSGPASAIHGSTWRATIDVFIEHRPAVVGLVVIIAMILFCWVGPLVYHTDQVHSNLAITNLPPGGHHPLGTDSLGYDILGRLMVGGQASLEIGISAAVLATTFGVLWGAVAGFAGGFVDSIMMRFVDTLLAIPQLFLLLLIATIVTPSVPVLVFVVAVVAWLAPARLVRAETLSLKTREYVDAARLMGARAPRIILRHIIPNTVGTIMVNATFQVADAILAVAALSFLGLGVPPPAASWGGMLSDGITNIFAGYWWQIYPAGIAIVITVVSFNLIGDAMRDVFEVRLRTQ